MTTLTSPHFFFPVLPWVFVSYQCSRQLPVCNSFSQSNVHFTEERFFGAQELPPSHFNF